MELAKGYGFAIVCRHRLLLSRIANSSAYKSFSIIKGNVEPGEAPLQTALREFKEETGNEFPISRIKNHEPNIILRTGDKSLGVFVVFIHDPGEIGMQSLEYDPKTLPQKYEISWAGFVDLKEVPNVIVPWQLPILEEIEKSTVASRFELPEAKTVEDIKVNVLSILKQYSNRKMANIKVDEYLSELSAFEPDLAKGYIVSRNIKNHNELEADNARLQSQARAGKGKQHSEFLAGERERRTNENVDNILKLAKDVGEEMDKKIRSASEPSNQLETIQGNMTDDKSPESNSKANEKKADGGTLLLKNQNSPIMENTPELAAGGNAIVEPAQSATNIIAACATSMDMTKIVTDNGKQLPYIPQSKVCPNTLGTVIPKGMASEMVNAISIVNRELQEKYGMDLDDFVQARLEYTPEELGIDRRDFNKLDEIGQKKLIKSKLCTVLAGEQVDAIALAIYNIEKSLESNGYGMIIGDQTGIGKGRSQSLDSKILTPTGWKTMGDMKIGSKVFAFDGTVTEVIGVYPQGKIDTYEIVFSDGSKTECSADHLWTARNKQQKFSEKTNPDSIYSKYKVFETRELMKVNRIKAQYSIPLVSPIQFPEKDIPIDPYLLGVILGDGCIRKGSVQVVMADDEILLSVKTLIDKTLQARKVHSRRFHYDITNKVKKYTQNGGAPNHLITGLRSLGLIGKTAQHKFIPELYKINSPEIRLAVLQGLMDTDGYVNANGSYMYYSVSNQLADDMIFLVQSLGGTATRGIKKTYRLDCHVVYMKLPNGLCPFRLLRKAKRVKPWTKYFPQRIIRSIKLIGQKECQCIKVSHPSSLYVTDDFIVTHNTAAALIRYSLKHLKKTPIFFTEKGYLFSDIYRDIADTKSDPMIALKFQEGEYERPIKMTDAEITRTIKARIEEEGETEEEARQAVEGMVVKGFKTEYRYRTNQKYESDIRAVGKNITRIVPFILNARANETKIRDFNGNIIYEPLAAEEQQKYIEKKHLPENKFGLIMSTYSQISRGGGSPKMNFLREMARGTIIICDESHNASGSSNTGKFIFDILTEAAGAAFLSATYAKRPDNMIVYAAKTAIREAQLSPEDLVSAIITGGVPLQEIISSELVGVGQMVRRERTYDGVNVLWNTLNAAMAEKTGHPEYDLKDKHAAISNMFTEILRDIIEFQKDYVSEFLRGNESFVLELLEQEFGTRLTIDSGQDVSKMLTSSPMFSRVFNLINQLLFSIKAEAIADRAINYMKEGKKPIIAFANTMGAFLDQMTIPDGDEERGLRPGDSIDTDFKLVLERLLETALSISCKDPKGGDSKKVKVPLTAFDPETVAFYKLIKDKIKKISIGITISPIDVLRYKISEAGFKVAEVTGRSGMVNYADSSFMRGVFELRVRPATTDTFRAFNENRIDCLLINQSGAVGASVHAAPNAIVNVVSFKNEDGSITKGPYQKDWAGKEFLVPSSLEGLDEIKQRVMVMLQAELNINTEVQKRGRIFRSGQLLPPMYDYISSAIPAEQRLQMMMQKKLHSLDANTSSNQKSSEEIVNIIDFLNPYGDEIAVKYLMENQPLIDRLGDPFKMYNDKNKQYELPNPIPENAAHKLSERVAVLSVSDQEKFYSEVSQKYVDQIKLLKDTGQYTGEVNYLDLQAVEVQKDIFQVGSGGKSAFGRNTIMELCDVNNLRKPYTQAEINLMLSEALSEYAGLRDPGKRAQGALLKRHKDFHEDRKEGLDTWYNERLERSIAKLREDEQYKKLFSKDPTAAESYAMNIETKIRQKSELDKADEQERIENQFEVVRNYLAKLEIGMVTHYVRGLVKVAAIITDITVDETRPNPFAPSAIYVRIAVANGIKNIVVPLSNSDLINSLIAERSFSNSEQDRVLHEWDSITKSSMSDRVKRYIMTGNILQAMGDPVVKENIGQLIKFTYCKNGKTIMRNGIILSEDFNPLRVSGARGAKFVMVPASKCLPVLVRLENNGRGENEQMMYETTNGIQFIRAKNGYDYLMRVPRDKEWRKVFNDQELLILLAESNEKGFTDWGRINVWNQATMKKEEMPAYGVTVPEEKMQELLDFISDHYKASFRIAQGVFDELSSQLGIDAQIEYNDGTEIEESTSGLAQAELKTYDKVNNAVEQSTQDSVTQSAQDVQDIELEARKKAAEINHEKEVLSYERKLFELERMLFRSSLGKKAEGGSLGIKKYSIQQGVGNAKYIVNYHDGAKRHPDGSAFYDIRIFSNKKELEDFEKELLKKGYIYKMAKGGKAEHSHHLEDLKEELEKLLPLYDKANKLMLTKEEDAWYDRLMGQFLTHGDSVKVAEKNTIEEMKKAFPRLKELLKADTKISLETYEAGGPFDVAPMIRNYTLPAKELPIEANIVKTDA